MHYFVNWTRYEVLKCIKRFFFLLSLKKNTWSQVNIWQSKLLTDLPATVNQYSADNQWSTYWPSVDRQLSTKISADSRPICRSSLGRYLGWYIGRYIDRHISVVISAESRSIWPPKYQSTVSGYIHRYISWVLVDMTTDISVEGCTK